MAQEYVHRASIPTESEADCLAFDGNVYFASHTNLFKTNRTDSSLFTKIEGTIRHFAVNRNNTFLCSDERVFMNYQENIIGSLKRKATAIASNEDIFAIGVDNALEVWNIPKEYKFTLFKRRAKILGHHGTINNIKIINNDEILTTGGDNTVRLFNISKHRSTTIFSARGKPVGIHTYEDGSVGVAAAFGVVTFLTTTGQVIKQVDLGNKLVSAGGHGDLFAILMEVPENREEEKKDEDNFHFKAAELNEENTSAVVDTNIIKPGFKRSESRSVIVVFRSNEEIYRVESKYFISRLCMWQQEIAVYSKNFVGVFNIQTEKFTLSLDLPKIVTFSVNRKGFIAVGCADGKARIYNKQVCKVVLYDEKSKGDILDAFVCENTCVVTYRNGHISAFNIVDSNCYRSFSIGFNDSLGKFTHSGVTDDGCVAFLVNSTSLFIVDMRRSKLIEEVKLESPLIRLIIYRDDLYYLTLGNRLVKYNYINSGIRELVLEYTGVGLAVGSGMVVISSPSGLTFYDLDFNFLNSINITLESRHREEVFSKPKPVEYFDFNSKHIICGGQSNKLKIVGRCSTGNVKAMLCMNEVVQSLKISTNKDWENYKERLDKERTSEFIKEHFIETRGIIASESCFYILTREGILIYETGGRLFNPVELSAEASPEFVKESISGENYPVALLAALQLRDPSLIKAVMEVITDVNFAVKFLPGEQAVMLMDCAVLFLRKGYLKYKMLEYIKWAIYHHKVTVPQLEETVKEGFIEEYEILRSNYYMLKNIEGKYKKDTGEIRE
ncbi:periodic tryptophan protein 2 [Pancytospora epiphaga]|nr:periodic tryptophan protein 2 [Pancytospora epiphaga]